MSKTSGTKILVVEDEPEICWIVKKVLTENGFIVELAFDGERGLESADRSCPNLVLLDLKLPGMDGFETLRRLRTRYAWLPVVILSAADHVGSAVRALKLGAYDYLSKPLNVEELLITLKNALQTSDLLSEVDRLKQQIAAGSQEDPTEACDGMPKVMDLAARSAGCDTALLPAEPADRSLKEIRQEVCRRVERETIVRALQHTHWNKARAAKHLRINYKTLFTKIKELGI